MNLETLLVAHDAGVVSVTRNRPDSKNALNSRMADELASQFMSLAGDEEARAVVLTGAGGNFCSGGDVRDMGRAGPRNAEQRRAVMSRYRTLVEAVHNLDKPVIAAVDGVAYGAGFSLALMADIVLVSDRVRLCMVFHRIGLVPDVGAFYTLPRVLGLQRAKELVFSAREIGAEEAQRYGLALEVVAPDALPARAMAIARSFCSAPPLAMSLSKRALQASLQSDIGTMLEMEASAQAQAAASDYFGDSVRRFGAKEAAAFSWPRSEP